MAKSKAQVLTLLQDTEDVVTQLRTFLAGTFTTTLDAAATAIAAGADEPEDDDMRAALKAVWAAGDALYKRGEGLFASIHKTLGRYAASDNLGDVDTNLAAFHDTITAATESVEDRGLTKFATWTAGGSNIGTGVFAVYALDPQSMDMDLAHIETKQLRCVRDEFTGGVRGRETFQLVGDHDQTERRAWDEGGSGFGKNYRTTHGDAINDFSSSVRRLDSGGTIQSVDGASGNNFILGGAFEDAITTTSVPSWTIVSGGAGLSAETTNQFKGTQSLAATANFLIKQSLETGSGPGTLTAVYLHYWVRVAAAVSAGTVTLRVIDDSTTHLTIAIDTTTLTNDTWTAIPTTVTNGWLVIPANIGENLRVELELTNYAGSGKVLVDEIVGAHGYVHEGYVFAIVGGLTDWRVNDLATGATTGGTTGKTQRAINEVFGKRGAGHPWLRHVATAGVGWPDNP